MSHPLLRVVFSAWALAAPAAGGATPSWETPGPLVGVSVEVEGRQVPLFWPRDGSARHYLEARPGARYSVRIASRSGERLGIVLLVDGLNAISGRREAATASSAMYVLDPWGEAVVSGWRTSLDEVRRFTFVDERASYAARRGEASGKMGWIEASVFRERPGRVWDWSSLPDREAGKAADAPMARQAPPASERRDESGGLMGRDAYPGTGWGHRDYDPVQEVRFDPQRSPAQSVVLRYEYAHALRALGILPWRDGSRDRLEERERGRFAPPPAW